MTTWSPTSMPVTSAPTSSTTPAPSWPNTLGNISAGRKLLIVMSEWHRPVATIRTSTSSLARALELDLGEGEGLAGGLDESDGGLHGVNLATDLERVLVPRSLDSSPR